MESDEDIPMLVEAEDDSDGEEVPMLVEVAGGERRKKVPVTVITGFLGAGKTTLLNHVMTAYHGKRVAVIQNEFGQQTGIEEAIVLDKDGDKNVEWLELPNGCVCCSVRSDLVRTVEYLVEKKDCFDYVLLETDGLAKPGPVAAAFWVDEELESGGDLYLDGIITVVDAKHLIQQLQDPAVCTEAQQQIALADRILINKTDLAAEQELLAVEQRVRSINKFASLVRTCRSELDVSLVLGIKEYDQARAVEIDNLMQELVQTQSSACQGCDDGGSHEHSCGEGHLNDIGTVCVTSAEAMDLAKVTRWLGVLAWGNNEKFDMMRMKGYLSIQGDGRKYALQGVHATFELSPSPIEWTNGERRDSKIVLIGKSLNRAALQAAFQECAWVPAAGE